MSMNVTFKKDEIYYYLNQNKKYCNIMFLKVLRDYSNGPGIAAGFKILNIFGSNNEFVVGEDISANQLSGVNVHGVLSYIFPFNKKELIEKVFSNA